MKAPLMWNVYVGDFNSQKIETYNIFTHGRFYEKLCKLAKDLRRQLKNGEKTAEAFGKLAEKHSEYAVENEIENKLWPLDVGELFMVGKRTKETLNKYRNYYCKK